MCPKSAGLGDESYHLVVQKLSLYDVHVGHQYRRRGQELLLCTIVESKMFNDHKVG